MPTKYVNINPEDIELLSPAKPTKKPKQYANVAPSDIELIEPSKTTQKPKQSSFMDKVTTVAKGVWDDLTMKTDVDDKADALIAKEDQRIAAMPQGWQKTTSNILNGVNKALNSVIHPIDTISNPITTAKGDMPSIRVEQKRAKDALRPNIDAVHDVSAMHNPADKNLLELGNDLIGDGDGSPKKVAQQDKQNYYNSVKKALGDGYEVQLEEGTLRPFFKKAGEGDDKYRPVLNDLFDSDGVEISERIKANAPTWVPEVAVDMAAFAAGAAIGKKYQVVGKAGATTLGAISSFLAKPSVLGTLSALSVSGATGAQSARAQIAYSGEELSQDQYDRVVNDEAINNALGNLVGIGVVYGAGKTWQGAKSAGGFISKHQPIHKIKTGAELYTDKNLVHTIEEDVNNRAALDMVGKMFGKVSDDERDLTYYMGFEEGRKVLRDLYNGNPEELKATLLDSIQLTKNLKDSMGLDDKTSKELFYFMQDGMNGVKAYYDRLYEQAKITVKGTIGKEVIPQQSQTLSLIDEMLDQAKRPINVKGEQVPEGGLNEFTKDYATLLENLKTLFRDKDEMSVVFDAKGKPNIISTPKYADDYTVEGILDVQKKFNDFFYKHKESFSRDQMETLSTLKEAIYADIENGIRHSNIDEESKDALMGVWQKTNSEYSQYKEILNNHQLLRKLLDKNEKFDVAAFTQKILSRGNEINGEDADTLSVFAKYMSKTQPERVNQFYESIVGGMIDGAKRKREVQMGKEIDYVAFDELSKMWNSLDDGIKNNIFSHTEEGKQMKATMDAFDTLAKREAALQDAIINEAKLPAVVAQERDLVRRFLYGAAYMAKAIAYDWWGARVIKAKAFQTYVQKLAQTQRYGDIERATNKFAYDIKANPPRGMSPKSIASLRGSINAYQKAMKEAQANQAAQESRAKSIDQEMSMIVEMVRNAMREFDPAEIAKREHEALKGELVERGGYSADEAEAMASGKELMGFKEYDAIRGRLVDQGYNEEEADDMLKAYLRTTDTQAKKTDPKQEVSMEEHPSFTDWNGRFNEWKSTRPAGESSEEAQTAWNEYVQQINDQQASRPAALDVPKNVDEWEEWNGEMYTSSSRDELDALIEEKSPKLNNMAENSMFAGMFADVVGGKSAQSIFSTFMGNKRQLSLKVASAVRQLFPKERREAIDTVNDYFGGSGSWGMFMAHPEMFPNVKSVNIYEYNPWRKFKIEMVHKQPQKVIDALKSDEIRAFYHVFTDYLKATTSSTGSAGQALPNIEKLLVSPEGEIPDAVKSMVMNMDQAHHAALMYMVDTAVRKFNSYESFISNAVQNISKTATYVRRLKKNGVEFNYHNMSSYDDIAEYNVGDNVLSVIDPPYYKTKGYSAGQNGDVRSSTVDIGIYAKTAKLIEDITKGRGSVIYTDEKWYTKIEKDKVQTGELTPEGKPKMKEIGEKEVDRELSDEFDTQKSGGKNAYELFKGIVAPFDHFFTERVSSRNETIAIKVGGDYDVTQYRNNTGTKGDSDVLRSSNDGGEPQSRGEGDNTQQRAEPVGRGAVAENGDGAGYGSAPRVEEYKGVSIPEAIDEEVEASAKVIDEEVSDPIEKIDWEARASELQTNKPDHYEIKALEALTPKDRGHTFSQSVIRPMQEGGKRINRVVAQKYDEAIEAAGKENVTAKAQELREADEMMKRERQNPTTPEAIGDVEHFKNYMKYTNGWDSLLKEFGENSGGVGRMVNKLLHDLKNNKPLSPEHRALWLHLSENMNRMRSEWEPLYKDGVDVAPNPPADSNVGKIDDEDFNPFDDAPKAKEEPAVKEDPTDVSDTEVGGMFNVDENGVPYRTSWKETLRYEDMPVGSTVKFAGDLITVVDHMDNNYVKGLGADGRVMNYPIRDLDEVVTRKHDESVRIAPKEKPKIFMTSEEVKAGWDAADARRAEPFSDEKLEDFAVRASVNDDDYKAVLSQVEFLKPHEVERVKARADQIRAERAEKDSIESKIRLAQDSIKINTGNLKNFQYYNRALGMRKTYISDEMGSDPVTIGSVALANLESGWKIKIGDVIYTVKGIGDSQIQLSGEGELSGIFKVDSPKFEDLAGKVYDELIEQKGIEPPYKTTDNGTRIPEYVGWEYAIIQDNAVRKIGGGYNVSHSNATKQIEAKIAEAQKTIDELSGKVNSTKINKNGDILDGNGNVLFAKGADHIAAGTVAGVETDEDGNIVGFSPEKFIIGMGGYAAAKSIAKHPKVQRELKEYAARAIQEIDDKAASGDIWAQVITGTRYAIDSGKGKSGGGFYHKADQVIESKLANRATPKTIMGLLKNNGVKEDEIQWSRIEEIANDLAGKDGKVNKGELMDAIAKERPKFGQVKYGKPDITDYDVRDETYSNIKDEIAEFRGITPSFQKALDEWYMNPTDPQMKENLQEVIYGELDYDMKVDDAIESAARRMNKGTTYEKYAVPYMGKNYREDLTTFDNRNDRSFMSSHWNDRNVMLHTRKKDIELDGDNTLLVEELQSDWHQEGRKAGYRDKEARKLYDQIEAIYDKYNLPFNGRITNRSYRKLEEAGLTLEEDKLIDRYESQRGIPQAPHSKTWHELGMKQVIDEAVAKGYDRVAWVAGDEQVKRYSLSKQVDRLVYNKEAGVIVGYQDGKEVMYQNANDDQLEAMIGKEPAKKLLANEIHNGVHEIKGEQLDLGGDGMRGFYDKMLPDFIRKYTKKWGTTLTKEKLPVGEEVWSFKVTDAMREDIKKNGQALYALPAAALFGYSQSSNTDESKTKKLFGSNL